MAVSSMDAPLNHPIRMGSLIPNFDRLEHRLSISAGLREAAGSNESSERTAIMREREATDGIGPGSVAGPREKSRSKCAALQAAASRIASSTDEDTSPDRKSESLPLSLSESAEMDPMSSLPSPNMERGDEADTRAEIVGYLALSHSRGA
jgi:hypothetical protein